MPLSPAVLGTHPDGPGGGPYSLLYGDVYHPPYGAWPQARHIFLGGNQLPMRWTGRDDFVILETGFGLGNNFLATWSAWRADPKRCRRLVFISIEKHPLQPADLRGVHARQALNDTAAPDHLDLAQRLIDAWPVLTPGLHSLSFDEGPASGVTLLLGLGDVAELLPQIVARVDAFYLDGFSPAHNPQMWDLGLLSRLGRLAAPDATAATWSSSRVVRDGLSRAGFDVERIPGIGGKRDMTVARFNPHHQPEPLPGGLWPSQALPEERHALIVGAGLAGCAAARALARQGWRCTVIEARATPAEGASGNPGGLFHSIIHGEDGLHARAHRAAALRTAALITPWLRQGRVAGACEGLLRLDTQMSREQAQALIQRQGLPDAYACWLDPAEAAALAGIAVPHGGWLFRQGGWVHPAGYAQALMDDARRHAPVEFMGGRPVGRLQRASEEDRDIWQAMDDHGRVIAQAPVVVLANAHGAAGLMSGVPDAAALPMQISRGQITRVPLSALADREAVAPRVPVAGAGYVLPAHQGLLLCGATNQIEDFAPQVRQEDHWHNLRQAAQLGSLPTLTELPADLSGRVGWRASTPDRLPYVGAWPASAASLGTRPGGASTNSRPPRTDQPRFWPRLRDDQGGVYVIAGLGSRGITWAALAGELLASWVTGTPSPVEAALRDALDPARIPTRARARPRTAEAAQADASDGGTESVP